MSAAAFIFARGGSKGLPRKNIRELCGKPLIAWSIDQAREAKGVDRVIVSTDSEEIASVAKYFGAEVPFIRPAELARDASPEWLAWRHALQHLLQSEGHMPEIMVSVPCTAPLRIAGDIDRCLQEYSLHACDAVITVTEANRSPYFNMVVRDASGVCKIVNQTGATVFRRQDVPAVYDMTTVAYVLKSAFVMSHEGLFDGVVRSVIVPKERAIDIDDQMDFMIAEMLMCERLGLS